MRKTFGGAALLLLLPGATAPTWAAPESEQITVDGPYAVRQEQSKGSMGGEMGEQHLSVSQNVSYADLDLTRYADVETLRQRVRTAAKDTCRELSRRFPVSMYIPLTTDTCARDAARNAMAQVDAAAAKSVASAGSRQTLARQDTRPLQ